MDFFQTICDSLPDYSEGNVWSNGSEILVHTESAAEALADIIEYVSKANGIEVLCHTGYYDPEEDKRNNEEDRYTGWWYVNVE